MVYCVVSCNILLKGFTRFCRCFSKFVSVTHPDLQIREVPSNPDPDIRRGGRSPKKISRPFGPQFGLKIREGRAPGPLHWICHCVYWSILCLYVGHGKGGGGGVVIYRFSWNINWPFHISRTINLAFYVSEEKINHQNHVSRGIERWFHNSRRIKQAIHGSRKYPLPPSTVRDLDLIRFVVVNNFIV